MNKIRSWMTAGLLIAISAGSGYSATKINGGTPSYPSEFGLAVSENLLWSFGADDDGVFPYSSLIADKRGNFYGTTEEGGSTSPCFGLPTGCGTVFELSPPIDQDSPWTEKILWIFDGTDGAGPLAGLIADRGEIFTEPPSKAAPAPVPPDSCAGRCSS